MKEKQLQLQSCLSTISQLFEQQELKYKDEMDGKDEVLAEAAKRIMDLEHENKRLQSLVSDLERKLFVQESENRSIVSSFNALSARYQNLKTTASQLEAFRKVEFVHLVHGFDCAEQSSFTSFGERRSFRLGRLFGHVVQCTYIYG
jgi:ABC-type transporter Mla subunit MlaD